MTNNNKEQDSPISIRINTDFLLGIKQSGESNSDFIRDAIQEKLGKENLETINEEIKNYQQKLKDCEQRKQLLQKKQKEMTNIPKKEISYLLETKRLIEIQPHFIEGRISKYINDFQKSYRITKPEFFKLLQEAENQSQENKMFETIAPAQNIQMTNKKLR